MPRCRQVAKWAGRYRGLQHGRPSDPLGLLPEPLWWRRYRFAASLVTTRLATQCQGQPDESERLRGNTSENGRSIHLVLQLYFSSASTLSTQSPLLHVTKWLQCDCISIPEKSPLAWFMFQSLLTGVITPEWDLNPRQAGRRAPWKQDLYYGEGGKWKLRCIFMLQRDGRDRTESCRRDGSFQRKSRQFSGDFYFVVSSNE